MASRATYLSLISALLFDGLNAQTGAGCFLKTCPQPGQVRIDAQFDAHGYFVGGCNCGCDPGLWDPASSLYCPEPMTINWDERTLLGDCSCQCAPGSPLPHQCLFPTVYDPNTCTCSCPSFAPDPTSCRPPTEYVAALCQCGCEIGSIGGPCVANGAPILGSQVKADCTCDTTRVSCPGNQEANPATGICGCPEVSSTGLYLPPCNLPLVRDSLSCDCVTTTTTIPPAGPIEVSCSEVGDCSCPFGTAGTCTITCDGTTDSCKDGLIECNNNGFDCIVNCLSGSACAGSAAIIGPMDGSLTVNCLGGQSCEGSVLFSADWSTDLTVVCEGSQACKGSTTFNFGSGRNSVACNGQPDSCAGGAVFNLPVGYATMPGLSFECTGLNCPPHAPAAFSNPVPVGIVPTIVPATVPGPSRPGASNPGTGLGQLPATPGGGNSFQNNQPLPVLLPEEIVVCEGVGATCSCSGQRSCTIQCETEQCKESTLNCADGYDCTVNCADIACQISKINGPIGGNLVVNCAGEGSCINTQFNAQESLDVSYSCLMKDACKGATVITCGTGACDVQCPGEASCDSASIDPVNAFSFNCYGLDAHCPPNYTPPPVVIPTPQPTVYVPCAGYGPCPCTHLQCFATRDPADNCRCSCPLEILLKEARGDADICGLDATHQVYHAQSCACDCPPNSQPAGGCLFGQTYNQNTCQCECPGGNSCPGAGVMNLATCQCECPAHSPTASDCSAIGKVLRNCQCDCPVGCAGEGQIQSSETCSCACPSGTPLASQCESGIVDQLACKCAAPIPSTFCCHTSTPNFKPWAGRCWDEQSEASCLAEPNGRCVWDASNCHPNPPENSINPGVACFMRDAPCSGHAQCCSEVCKIDGMCR